MAGCLEILTDPGSNGAKRHIDGKPRDPRQSTPEVVRSRHDLQRGLYALIGDDKDI